MPYIKANNKVIVLAKFKQLAKVVESWNGGHYDGEYFIGNKIYSFPDKVIVKHWVKLVKNDTVTDEANLRIMMRNANKLWKFLNGLM